MCLYPKLIRNRKYTSNKKNDGIIPVVTDPRVLYVPIGCQKCIECRKQKARSWQVRLLEDIKTQKNGRFLTLTFSNESITQLNNEIPKELQGYDRDNAIATLATRRFLERWRKKYKRSLRHWLVTELGHNGTEHLHLHGIIWTDTHIIHKKKIINALDEIQEIWQYGWIWKGHKTQRGTTENYVNGRTASYITKYLTKTDELHEEYQGIILTSPGIGNNYTNRLDSKNNKYNGKKTIETYRTDTGHKISMPIYWRNKIYTDNEREKLWLQRLDKEERWICGEKVSVKNGDHTKYYKLLEWHRTRNKKLGYGDDSINWEKKKYEQQRRNLKIQERINTNTANTRGESATAQTAARNGALVLAVDIKGTDDITTCNRTNTNTIEINGRIWIITDNGIVSSN